ncbi:hypothetical protein BsWGS_07151 [Bradybaena similaris]
MATVKCLASVFLDIIIVVAVWLSAILMRKFCVPYERGFFKDDESIMHPFHGSTIPSSTLYAVGFTIPVITMILLEIVNRRQSKSSRQLEDLSDREKWFVSCFHMLAMFFFGAGTAHFLTDIPKYAIGRLRPHFFDVCKPNWNLLNNTSGYITVDICTGEDKALIQEARLSFPSGHSSMAMYCAFFFILYLEWRLTWRVVPLLRPLLQLIAFSFAFFTCLSRISDYKHHWSDVLAGGILGVAVGCLVFYCAKPRQAQQTTCDDSNP